MAKTFKEIILEDRRKGSRERIRQIPLLVGSKLENKLFAVRFLDQEKKRTERCIEQISVLLKSKENQKNISYTKATEQVIQLMHAWDKPNDSHMSTFHSSVTTGTHSADSEEYLNAHLNKAKETWHTYLEAIQKARSEIFLTSEQEKQVDPDLAELYQEQVNKRKWFQHGAVAVVFAILFFPISPFIYLLWKNERNKEEIQINPQTELEKQVTREHRKASYARIWCMEK